MSTESKDLISLVEKLRQEQEFISFYKTQVRQSIQELNAHCNGVFHSMWLNHTLSYSLNRVLAHHLHCSEWSMAFDQVDTVDFVDASRLLGSRLIIEKYSKFLSLLLNDPKLLAELLHFAEREGLHTSLLVSDLMSAVYGHYVFQHDHTQLLHLMKELLKHQIGACESPRDLFSGVEPIFSFVLTEYCGQLVSFRTFLTEALQEPLMRVLACDDYLEYDVNKAGSRFQSSKESQNGPLVDTSSFLFNEDLESSCQQLADLATQFLESLSKLLGRFPLTLKWLLGNLKSLVQYKWPGITLVELRRPISDMLFGSILGSAIVNPDSYGIVDPNVVIGAVARYNLSQVTSVLQGCAWMLDKPSSTKYPINKVVKRVNTKTFLSLVDCVDGGYGDEPLELSSSLPGLRRSAYLASQTQLNQLVGLLSLMANTLAEKREGFQALHLQICSVLSHILPLMKDMATAAPYAFSNKPTTLPKPAQMTRQDSSDSATLQTATKSPRRVKKRRSDQIAKAPPKTLFKKRSNSVSTLALVDVKPVLSVTRSRAMTRSVSPQSSLHVVSAVSSERFVSPTQGSTANFTLGFQLPSEVLILPILEADPSEGKEIGGGGGVGGGVGGDRKTIQWDFDLLSEEEFLGQQCHSPALQRVDSLSFSDDLLQFTPETTRKAPPRPPPPDDLISLGDEIGGVPRENWQQFHDQSPLLGTQEQNGHLEFPNLTNGHRSPSPRLTHRKKSYKRENSPIVGKSFKRLHEENGSPVTTSLTALPVRIPSPKLSTYPSDSGSVDSHLEPKSGALSVPDFGIRSRSKSSPDPMLSPVHAFGEIASEEEEIPANQNLEIVPTGKSSLNADVRSASDGSGLSTENLLDEYAPVEGGAPPPNAPRKGFKKFRKLKDRFRKRPKDDQPKLRRKSEEVRKKDAVAGEDLLDSSKPRSKSEHHVQDDASEEDESPKKTRKARRSYTILLKDITDKYATGGRPKSKESPAGNTTTDSPANSPSSSVAIPSNDSMNVYRDVRSSVARMSPARFSRSLYCSQLQYKLRVALQRIHTPLSTSPVYLQLCADEDSKCDSRYHLVTLLQGALQRSKWRHDDMEIALLTESLRMVEPLPNQLVAEVMEGVHQDYVKRSAYISYLVKSHQKFQDAKLQVAAVQTAISRMKQVQEEQFVNFAVKMFLETQESELRRFVHQMEGLDLADERCSLMEVSLETFSEAIQESGGWLYWPDTDQVVNCLEDHLFAHVYKLIFHPNGDSDTMRDQIFSGHLSKLSDTITPTHKSLQIPTIYHSSCPWMAAQKHLKVMAVYKSPRGKVRCIVQSCRVLISLLQYAKCGDPPGADDMFPVLVYVLIKANPPGLLSTIQYIKNFAESQLGGEDAYWWAQFSTAVEFTKTLE